MKLRMQSLLSAGLLLAGLMFNPSAHASFGAWAEEKALGLEQRLAGLETRQVTVGDHDWVIFTRNLDSKDPCIVMVHGFTARAAHWFRMARKLPEQRCIIAVDLPGFGDSTFRPTAAYTPADQADRLSALLKALPLGTPQADLIGNSMGGFVIAEFALRHPDQTHSIALMDAAGVSSPVKSELTRQIEAGKNGFFARDMAGFRTFAAMTMSEPPYIPGFILDAVGAEAIERVPRHEYIFGQLQGPRLDDRLGQIKTPTLIIWGDEDKLLHVSMTSVWRKIPGSRVFLFKGVGHMPHMERPAESADLYHRFLTGKL